MCIFECVHMFVQVFVCVWGSLFDVGVCAFVSIYVCACVHVRSGIEAFA